MIPKDELHCHLEGSIPPKLALELARRNNIELPDGMFDARGHYVWRDFLSFLDAYDRVCRALKTARDFGEVMYAYLKDAAAEGAVYVEMFCSPERPKALGIGFAEWQDTKINLIDAPGFLDFLGEATAALHSADAAVVVGIAPA